MYLKINDEVMVMRGKDAGKTGRVIAVDKEGHRVRVSGMKMVVKHQKPRGGQAGERFEMEGFIHASNVMLLDPESKKATRIAKKGEGTKKIRISVKSKKEITAKKEKEAAPKAKAAAKKTTKKAPAKKEQSE